MYQEFKKLDLPKIDAEMLRFWEENDSFHKSVNQRDPENSWVFYEGPPSANGKPGIHHVMSRTIKDLFCRYRSMKGQRVQPLAELDPRRPRSSDPHRDTLPCRSA